MGFVINSTNCFGIFFLSMFLSFHLFCLGPKLFKEPSSKSNKPIIINAIAHCCLAGKVNESQKNAVLEVGAPAPALIRAALV